MIVLINNPINSGTVELFVFGPYKPYFFVDLSVFASRDSKVIGRQGYVMNIIHLIIYIYTHILSKLKGAALAGV